MNLTHHDYVCHLSNCARVVYNRIQGHSIEEVASMCLRPLTKREAREFEQMMSDDDVAHAEDCAREREGLVAASNASLIEMPDLVPISRECLDRGLAALERIMAAEGIKEA